ncbi:DUF4142 domain-containing protein [Stenotrophomonas sp.]|uniref:DUF4142 domain-containing protein n=1 Tax=Stenotrophomonas sp. TaxID=69392 RepID=UPI0028A6AD10|nr:DUF4142 domain-containing protein [Stenotrophomonas sp.]
MNNRILMTALALASALSLAGCRDEPGVPADSDTAAATTPGVVSPDPTTPRTESPAGIVAPGDSGAAGEMRNQSADERSALGVLNAINDHEIAAGRQAQEKKVTGDVADYAQLMIDEHTRNKEQTNALNPDANSAEAKDQAAKGQAQLQQMAANNGDAYRKAYVDAMIDGHAEALAMLDEKLIPSAAGPQAKAHLQQTREHVARHLALARALKKDGSVTSTDDGRAPAPSP